MNRRDFLSLLATAGAAAVSPSLWAAGLPRDIRITRVIGFDLISQRAKFCSTSTETGYALMPQTAVD